MRQNVEFWFKAFGDYLHVAELIKKEIDEPKHKENWCNESASKLTRQNEVNLRGPLIYIFKHSVELFLKSGIIYINDGCIDSLQMHHNIKKLFNDFKNDLESTNNVIDNEDTFKERSLSKKSLSKLEIIVTRYLKLGTIDKALTSENEDDKNTTLKYPDNKTVDYFSFWYGSDEEKIGERIAEIEEDIRDLEMISSELRGHVF